METSPAISAAEHDDQQTGKPESLREQATHRFCVAPMMDCTDRHDRFLLRLISRHTRLYTEMLTTGALLFGDRNHLLEHHPRERPLALQLGGNEPAEMARCAELGQRWGYDEINMNVGCPSDRVRNGHFGACLMAEPQRVAACVAAMRAAVTLPVTVKTRIGIDQQDSFAELCGFVEQVAVAGCGVFIVHARKAWLTGLSAKQNRTLPPLRYDVIYRLQEKYPQLQFVLNGGIGSLTDAAAHLHYVPGVMLGRAAYRDPFLLAEVDRRFFAGTTPPLSRAEVVSAYADYAERELTRGVRLTALTRHIVGLFQGRPGAKAWRRYLSEHAHLNGAGAEVIRAASRQVPECRGWN